MKTRNSLFKKPIFMIVLTWMIFTLSVFSPAAALAASASEIDRDARASLAKLYQNTPGAKALADKAVAVLIFPSIVKGGFIFGGQFGDGALRRNGKTISLLSLVGGFLWLSGGDSGVWLCVVLHG